MKAHLLFCGILAIAQWGDCFTVLHPPELVGNYNSPWLRNFPTNISREKPLVAQLTGSVVDNGPREGIIVFGCFEDESGTLETIIRRGVPNFPGLLGWLNCVKFTDVPGSFDFTFDGTDLNEFGFPVWDTAFVDTIKIRDFLASDEPNRTIVIEIGWDDPNEWAEMHHSGVMIAFSIIIGGYSFAVAALAMYKQAKFIRIFGASMSLPQVILWIEIFANIERGVYSSVDPLFNRRIFPALAMSILLTLSFPTVATTSLLITLYWKELLSSSQTRVITFLSKLKVPFIVIVILMWGIELTAAFLRGFGIGPLFIMSIIVTIFYFIVAILTASFFIHYGRKINAALSAKSTTRVTTQSNKFKAVNMLIASAAIQIAYCPILLLPALNLYYIPYGFFAANFFLFLLMITISLFKTLAFVTPSAKTPVSKSNPNMEAMSPRPIINHTDD